MLTIRPDMMPLILGIALIIGMCVGSFANVMALRFLSDENVSHPPSKCPKCQTPIRKSDNIPVLSYILLGGACRACKEPISIQYPLVEIGTGVLFAAVIWKFGVGWQSLFLLYLMFNLVVIFVTDFLDRSIFTLNSHPLMIAGLIYSGLNLANVPGDSLEFDLMGSLVFIPAPLLSAVLAMILSIVFFEGIRLLSMAFLGTEGFGRGDTYLMMGAGAYLGWPLTLLSIFLGFMIQAVPAVPMLVVEWIKNKMWPTLTWATLATVAGVMPLFVVNMVADPASRAAITLGCIVVSLIALVMFMRQVKIAQSFTYLPLGPSLVLGIIVSLFWGPELVGGYAAYLQSQRH